MDRRRRESVAEHLPEGIREVIGRRLDRLSEAANRMLSTAAAMPGGFTLDVVRTVTGDDEDAVLDLLDEALEAQIVRERTGARARTSSRTRSSVRRSTTS